MRSDAAVLMEMATTAKYGLLTDRRSYGWILTTTIGPFFLLAPFTLMAESLVGPVGRFNQPFFEATGYSNPLSIYPGWIEWLARLIPFTWAFDLERRAFLRAETLDSILPDLLIFLGLTLVWWVAGYICFRFMLSYSRRKGRLGIY